MSTSGRVIFIICADPGVTRGCIREIISTGGQYQLRLAGSVEQGRRGFVRTPPAAIFLDESAVNFEGRNETLLSTIPLLTKFAPVVVAAEPERQFELAFLIASGAVDFVARTEPFLPIAAGLLERRMRPAETTADGRVRFPGDSVNDDFGEILRHEVNNPLTGILGNAELLLARRNKLPPATVTRLQTIAELAVRLRETVRRLSNAWDTRPDRNEGVGSAKTVRSA
ncbi:MAG: histidine kinase dimerization/phospho-acceptor domain-containing protein [Candidatus Acidiferrales bacterium]